MSKLTIIRGLPGSGKSTMARKMGIFHVEADMFHMKNGGYNFEFDNVKAAHAWCKNVARAALVSGVEVVVSNTFTQRWEMTDYYNMAEDLGAEFEVIVATGDYESVHNVPADVIQKMKDRWEI